MEQILPHLLSAGPFGVLAAVFGTLFLMRDKEVREERERCRVEREEHRRALDAEKSAHLATVKQVWEETGRQVSELSGIARVLDGVLERSSRDEGGRRSR